MFNRQKTNISEKKSKKDLILFYSISLIWSVILGMLQYFLWSHLKGQGISLEKIAGYISLGMTMAYLIGGPLSHAFKKKWLSVAVSLVSIVSLLIFYLLGVVPLNVFIIITSTIGFSCGIWAIIKHIILSFEIHSSGIRETIINGILNVCTLGGALVGSYLGLKIFEFWSINGYFFIIGLLIMTIIISKLRGYDKFFRRKSFKIGLKEFLPELKLILKKYYWLLIPIGSLWAISVGFSQKIFYISVNTFHIAQDKAIFLYVYSALGAIIGFIISTLISKNKKLSVIISTILSTILLLLFSRIIHAMPSYNILKIGVFILGIVFGILINILEGRYFWYIGKDHDKEYGAAIYGVIMNIMNFSIMIISDILLTKTGINSTFIFFGVIMISMTWFFKHLKQ